MVKGRCKECITILLLFILTLGYCEEITLCDWNEGIPPCRCDGDCVVYRDCCPDYTSNIMENKTDTTETSTEPDTDNLVCENITNGDEKFWLMAAPEDGSYTPKFHNILERCFSPKSTNPYDSTPVYNPNNNKHYRNIFCAILLDLDDRHQFVFWNIELSVSCYNTVTAVNRNIELPDFNTLLVILFSGHFCYPTFSSPLYTTPRRCDCLHNPLDDNLSKTGIENDTRFNTDYIQCLMNHQSIEKRVDYLTMVQLNTLNTKVAKNYIPCQYSGCEIVNCTSRGQLFYYDSCVKPGHLVKGLMFEFKTSIDWMMTTLPLQFNITDIIQQYLGNTSSHVTYALATIILNDEVSTIVHCRNILKIILMNSHGVELDEYTKLVVQLEQKITEYQTDILSDIHRRWFRNSKRIGQLRHCVDYNKKVNTIEFIQPWFLGLFSMVLLTLVMVLVCIRKSKPQSCMYKS